MLRHCAGILVAFTLATVGAALSQEPPAIARAVPEIASLEPELESLYRDLHQHPELAFHEQRTAAALADRLRVLGFDVATGVGGTGLVAILRNGPGPVVMLRTELDALPLEEKTGLPFASTVKALDAEGKSVPVAHACGHDLHMTGWYGTAKIMAQRRNRWQGTLMLVGQPAEEITRGAAAMLADGLFTRFPKPDFAISMHDEPSLPSGKVGFHPGFFRASSDAVEVTIFGRGGHGGKPQLAVDPVVIAARSIVGIQTIVSRETDPLSPAVVTIGSIHGGSAGNIIPDEVRLQMSVRAYDDKVRKHILASIKRQLDAEAEASDAPAPPSIKITPGAEVVFNDPQLTTRLADALRRDLGPGSVVEMPAKMTSEDFSEYGRAGVRTALLHIGAVNPEKLASGARIPDLHSPLWFPELKPTLRSLVAAEVVMLSDLLAPAQIAGN
ncbi:amidohydrolase [Occallatibacter savannae]|uniref:amidohydrolase n=1 Tax=Occallatibacter savannae TaxID=1002691 RepID=UPI000D69C5CA|nr:amidohydrolase [Occallatibacter savannae]